MADEMSEELSQPAHPVDLEISTDLYEKLCFISTSGTFAVDATLHSAFADVKQLVKEILNAPAAYPVWLIDDLEEQLASSRRVADRRASSNGPTHSRGDKISDPPTYDGNCDTLEGCVAQLRLKLFSDPTRFPTPTIQMVYTFNRLQGQVQAQVLPFIKGETIEFEDAKDIIWILHNAFDNPDPVATACAKLTNLKQGKKEFNMYFAEFQMLVSKLNWNEDAKLDALHEGMSHDLRRLLLGRTKKLTFDELVALCQETDTESCAIYLSEGRSYHQQQRIPQGHAQSHAPATTATHTANPPPSRTSQAPHPDAMDLSTMGGRGKISEEERATRLREGRCLFCGGVGHMARHCPNKNRNPFRAAAAQTMLQQDQNLANANPNTTPTPTDNPNRNLYPNPFYGNEGNTGRGVGGGQGQSGNA